jgi:prephenate dehydratase
MAETIRQVDYFYVQTPDKPGEAANVLARIKAEGVNLLAFSGFPSGRRSQMDFIPADTEAFKKAARRAGLKLSPRKTGFLVQGGDRVGALADLLGKLAAAKINVTAVDAVCAGEDRYGAILWVKPPAVRRAAKALGI